MIKEGFVGERARISMKIVPDFEAVIIDLNDSVVLVKLPASEGNKRRVIPFESIHFIEIRAEKSV